MKLNKVLKREKIVMRLYHNYIRALLALLTIVSFVGCDEKLPTNVESTDYTVLKSISIINAGANGDEVVNGVVNESEKSVWFPRIVPETDLKNLKFRATMSDGAVLEQDSYSLQYAEGESEKTIVLKVINNKRFREYFATVRLLVPVFGAEWTAAKVFDFSANPIPNDPWPNYSGLAVRGGGFSTKWVAVPSRATAHVISTDEIRAGNSSPAPIPLNMDGVKGGTFVTNGARVIGTHIYMAALSGTSIPRIYHWSSPEAKADVLSDGLTSPEGIKSRLGDTFNIDLDENGNGYIFFGENSSTPNAFTRITVRNWTETSDPKLLGGFPWMGTWSFYTRIDGSDKYLVTSLQMENILLADEDGNTSVAIPSGILPANAGDPRVIHFNQERYLLTVDGARIAAHGTPAIRIYNITQGDTVEEALEIVRQNGTIELLYEHSLGGANNGAPGTRSAYDIIKDENGKDETLLIYGSVANSGFAVLEFPIKKVED